MRRIDVATAVATAPSVPTPATRGYFTNGNPGGGIPATEVPDWWLNMVDNELEAVVVAAGLTPDKATWTQLRDSIYLLSREQATRGALLSLTGGQSIPNNTETAVSWPDPVRETDDVWGSGAPTRFIIPTGVSLVRFVGQVTFASNGTGSRKARVLKNGTNEGIGLPAVRTLAAGGTDVTVIQLAGAIVPVAAGDYFDVRVTQDSGGALNILATNTWWSIELLK